MKRVNEIPALGFGTYGRWGAAGESALRAALACGYRHLDTAQSYNTEAECGRAIQDSGIDRDDIWVTTKIDMKNFGPGKLVPSLQASLTALGLEQVDLTLIHWPSPNGEVPLAVYLEQLADAKEQGLTKHIGVSNFTIALLNQAVSILGKDQILTNQFELNPYLSNAKLATHCQSLGIAVTAYQPVGKARINSDPVLKAIAKSQVASVTQVALAWEIAKGYVAIPTSGNAAHIRENYGALALTLSAEEISAIDALNRNERHVSPSWGPEWD